MVSTSRKRLDQRNGVSFYEHYVHGNLGKVDAVTWSIETPRLPMEPLSGFPTLAAARQAFEEEASRFA